MSDSDAKGQAFFERLRTIDPALYLQGLGLGNDIRAPGMRLARAECLHAMLQSLFDSLQLVDFRDDIVIRPEGVFVSVGGILLDAHAQWLYLKASGAKQQGIGPATDAVLKAHGIEPRVIVDVGSNYGEMLLWFAREYPDAKIVGIEPVPANREVFERNRRAQAFSADHVRIVPVAVMDRKGTVDITTGVSTMNRVVPNPVPGTETVDCDRLENILAEQGVETADVVKVDIEGAEHHLSDTVLKLGPRVRSWVFEFSKFAPFEQYMKLATALLGAGFSAWQEDGATRLADLKAVEQHLKEVFTPEATVVTNLWFFAK